MIDHPHAAEWAAATVALQRKPRGKQARTFYRYAGKLVDEFESLCALEGDKARQRQIAIGEELALYKFPAPDSRTEYCIAQDAGRCEYVAKFGGEFRGDEDQAGL